MKKVSLCLLFFLSWTWMLHGQTFKIFDPDRELSSSLINALFQDSYGMMWIATEEGLNRYDGNKFNVYRNITSDSTSLCSNYVNSLFETGPGELFICTRRGIQMFCPASGTFSPRITDYNGTPFIASVVQAVKRNKNEYWVIGDSIRIFTPTADGFMNGHLEKVPDNCSTLSHIHCGITDPEGNLWLSLSDRGIVRINKDNTLSHYFGLPGDPNVSSMTIGRDGLLYLGSTDHGLLRFNSSTDKFEFLSPSSGKEIKSLYVDRNGDILQATDGTGIIVYKPAENTTQTLSLGNSGVSSSKGKTHCVLRDADDNLWIGVFQTGVLMSSDITNSFAYIGSNTPTHDVIGSNCVSSIYRGEDGTLWIGTDNDGIYSLNNDYTLRSHFYNGEIAVPMCIFEDSRKNLWVGTYLHGVGTMDRNTGKMTRIQIPEQSDIPANMCFAITEDRDHNVWLGMLNSGLIKYDLDNNRAITDFPWRDQIARYIASLYYSGRTNTLYVGTYSGLEVVNNLSQPTADVIHLYQDDIVHSIDESGDGLIWVGTTNGLICYNPADGTTKRFNVTHDRHAGTVYAVRCDDRYVWMSLNSGISRLDPTDGSVAVFMVNDGLQGNEFYKNAVFKDRNGHIYFGGTKGITHFNPKEITTPGRQWTPRVIDIYSHGVPVGRETVPFVSKEIDLPHQDNSFSVEFGTRELGRPESVVFAYSIDGSQWEVLPSGTYTVNFHDLNPGKHKLAFKSIDNLVESPVETMTITVEHPWYTSPWVMAIYFIIIILLLWWTFYSYNNRMKNRAALVELQHSDQLNEARLRSYVNISHEIRTPMSLVISPLQKLLANDHDQMRQREYKLIMRNAKRVLRLIDELMDLRKIEKNQMHLNLQPTRIVPFIQDICDTFAQAVADKEISLAFLYDNQDITADIDRANFDKILMNLVSNAVKYTPKHGKITIRLRETDKNIEIRIIDTGVGIPESDRARIFERFYQVKDNKNSGTGVGLHLTKQLVTLHNGDLTVTDNPDENGTCFILTLPPASDQHISPDTAYKITKNTDISFEKNDHIHELENMKIPDYDIDPATKAKRHEAKVLIIEDDEQIRDYITEELSDMFHVESCGTAEEAMDKIFTNPPQIILSDIMLPGMSGLELTRSLKQNINTNHIPVILLSALTRDEDTMKGIAAGADAYFHKPFNIELVKGRMAALIHRYRQLKNIYEGRQEQDEHIDNVEMESADEKFMRRVMAVINSHLDDPELSVEKMAADVGVSRVHLHRKLKELTNQSPSDFIRNTRLRQAASLLKQKKFSVAEVAYATGFCNASTFSSAFKKFYGQTPSTYSGFDGEDLKK